MTKFIPLMILGCVFVHSVSAQDSYQRAMEPCGDTRESSPPKSGMQMVFSVTGWTGGCVDGKRDGRGVLTWSMETTRESGLTTVVVQQWESHFVKGQPVVVGLSCITRLQQFRNGKPVERTDVRDNTGCSIARAQGLYRKLPDGRWQLMASGLPADPPAFLAAGALEVESARLLAAAAAGVTDLKPGLVVQSQALDDLVRGSKIVLAPVSGPISLKDKRVAVVLSSNMIAELERFKRERESLIAATSGLTGRAAAIRTEFIAASSPDRFLVNVVKVLKRFTKDVQPADGLAGLREAGFDYALVLDWKYTTRLDLQGKYDAFPTGTYEAMSTGKIPPLKGGSMSGFLISPDLKAVRQYPGSLTNHPKHPVTGTVDDSDYLSQLHHYYESYWGKSPDDDGDAVSGLKQWLR